jgi:hypothetical protein
MFFRDRTGSATITISESGLAKETTQVSGNSKLEDIKALLTTVRDNADTVEALLTALGLYLDTVETVLGTETAAPPTGTRINGWLQSIYNTLSSLLTRTPDGQAELTARMLAKLPATGYRLWFDTANASHIYILEAPAANGAGTVGFLGIRVTKDADGNPLGKVQVNTSATLTFDNRTSDPGWA